MQSTPVAAITSGTDLFFCEPYNCKLLARACVERQARFEAGIEKTALRLCGGCELGRQVKDLSGVVIDPASLVRKGRPPARTPAAPISPAILISISEARARGSDSPPTIVSEKQEPATPSLALETPAELLPAACEVEIASAIEAEATREPAQQPKPAVDPKAVTREKLERAIVLHGKIRSDGLEEDFEDWFDFLELHGLETLCLALAALGRLEPRRAGMTYLKHKLGDVQERAVRYIRDNPRRTTSEIAAALGANYQNIRHTLQALEPRGLIRREHDPVRAAMVWMRSDAICAKDVTAPICDVDISTARFSSRK